MLVVQWAEKWALGMAETLESTMAVLMADSMESIMADSMVEKRAGD